MRILVLCTGNSCRSQMAEGFFRVMLPPGGEVCSAGISPKGIHPLAAQVMKEVDVDISGQTSDAVERYTNREFDYVITVCDNAAERCPHFPGKATRLHWPFEDPAHATGAVEEQLGQFRKVRDQIGARIEDWLSYSE